jgi:hypothetical protein
MAGISKRVWIFLIATSAIAPLVQASEPPPVHYDIGLDVTQGDVEAITVRATVRTGDDGVVDFDPPSQAPAEVHAESGSLDTSTAGRWHVTSAPGAEVVLVWRSPRPERLLSVSLSAWQKVIAQPGTVFAFGGVLLAIPKGPVTRRATVTISLPPGWQGASGTGNGSSALEKLPYMSFVASRDLYTVTRPIGTTNTLHVASTGGQTQDVDKIATLLAATLRAVGPKDVTLTLLIFNEGDGTGYSTAGTAATMLLSRYDPSHPWLFGLVGDLGSSNDTPGDATNAWFTRGFTGYRIANALLASGVFDNTSFARHLDQTLNAYGGSPLRRASNANVADDYDRIREMHDLPAVRGELFAWLIDARIREATQGRKRLSDALQRVGDSNPDPGHALIAAVAAEGGGDITPLYQRYIVDGELLQLPPDTLGPCFAIGTVAYDYGWQVQHVFAKPAGRCVGAASAAMPHVGAASAAKPGRDAIRR